MRAGDLRDRVYLEAPVTDPGSEGWGPSSSYARQAQVWASVRQDGGTEKSGEDGTVTANQWTIRIRYRTDIGPTWRVVFGSRTFDLLSVVDPEGRKRELVIKGVESPQAA